MGVPEVIAAINEPAKKLIDAVSGAIGKAYEPKHIRKMAEADAYRIEQIASALRNNCDLPITYNANDGTVQIDIRDFEELKKRAGFRLAFQEIRKQENIEAVVDTAYDILQNDNDNSDDNENDDKQVSNDWMLRFINSVEDVSNEDMRLLWAKVLAGEIKHPSSFSLRTLDVLRNLSQEEAELFSKVAKVVIKDYVYMDNANILKKHEVTFGDIIKLDDCGLISSSVASINHSFSKKTAVSKSAEHIFFVEPKSNANFTTQFNIRAVPLTSAGLSLLKIIGTNIDEDYYIEVCKDIANSHKSFTFSLYKLKYFDADNDIAEYDDVNLILL